MQLSKTVKTNKDNAVELEKSTLKSYEYKFFSYDIQVSTSFRI